MIPQEKCTAGGAASGGVAGSLLTNQSTLGTVGGAAVGGVVGHEVGRGLPLIRTSYGSYAGVQPLLEKSCQ